MSWEKQENAHHRHLCPSDTMSFCRTGICIGAAAIAKLRLSRFSSVDVLIDKETLPKKVALHFHEGKQGQFCIGNKRSGSFIPCVSAMRPIIEIGFSPGRYWYRADQPELIVFDLGKPAGKLWVTRTRGGK